MNLYEVLGVQPNAEDEEIIAEYKKRVRLLHPDKETGDTKKMARLNEAYHTLLDPFKRCEYDRDNDINQDDSESERVKQHFADILKEHIIKSQEKERRKEERRQRRHRRMHQGRPIPNMANIPGARHIPGFGTGKVKVTSSYIDTNEPPVNAEMAQMQESMRKMQAYMEEQEKKKQEARDRRRGYIKDEESEDESPVYRDLNHLYDTVSNAHVGSDSSDPEIKKKRREVRRKIRKIKKMQEREKSKSYEEFKRREREEVANRAIHEAMMNASPDSDDEPEPPKPKPRKLSRRSRRRARMARPIRKEDFDDPNYKSKPGYRNFFAEMGPPKSIKRSKKEESDDGSVGSVAGANSEPDLDTDENWDSSNEK